MFGGIDWVGWRLAYEKVHVYSESCFYMFGGIDWVGWRLAYEKVHVCSESCFYTFGRIDWVGWRLARGEDGRGWPTRVSQEIPHILCKMSVIVEHLITSQFE